MSKVTVCIWMPTGIHTKLGIGHAAIQLKNHGQEHYITWSAQGNPLRAPFKAQNYPRFKKLGLREEDGTTLQYGYEDDKYNMEGYFGQADPHHTIKLPILRLQHGRLTHGVSVRRLLKFWNQRLQETMYAFFSARYNCTGCVCEALKAGGLGSYHNSPDSIFIQGAAGLLSWVTKANNNIRDLNTIRQAVEDKMAELAVKYPLIQRSVPSLAEWKADSDSNLKFAVFASRRDQVAALDKLIEEYFYVNDDVSRFVLLFRMQSEIHSHLTAKPNSDRKLAVERLGARVTAVLNALPGDLRLEGLETAQYTWVMNTIGWRAQKNLAHS